MTDFEFESCIHRIQAGEKEGLKQIYESYIGLIYTVIYDILGQKEDAQDVASEFFIRLWDKADTYRFGGKHKAWMIKIARNMAIDFLRKHKREVLVEELPEPEAQKEDFTAQVVGRLTVKEKTGRLKPGEQEVLDLKILGDFTFREIAKILDKPMGTVTWLYREAIKKLKQYHMEEKEVQE